MKLNHVTSSKSNSLIFNDMMAHANQYKKQGRKINVFQYYNTFCNGFHEHRPHLTNEILHDSFIMEHHDVLDTPIRQFFQTVSPKYRTIKNHFCFNIQQQIFLKIKDVVKQALFCMLSMMKFFHLGFKNIAFEYKAELSQSSTINKIKASHVLMNDSND